MSVVGTYSSAILQNLVTRLVFVQDTILESGLFLKALQCSLGCQGLVGLVRERRNTDNDSFIFDFIVGEPHLVL
jgi:hypothetical protein